MPPLLAQRKAPGEDPGLRYPLSRSEFVVDPTPGDLVDILELIIEEICREIYGIDRMYCGCAKVDVQVFRLDRDIVSYFPFNTRTDSPTHSGLVGCAAK